MIEIGVAFITDFILRLTFACCVPVRGEGGGREGEGGGGGGGGGGGEKTIELRRRRENNRIEEE